MKRILSLALLATLCLAASAQLWLEPQGTNFKLPAIDYTNKAEGTEGLDIYKKLVPNPNPFIQHFTRAKIQFFYKKQ